MSHFLLLQSSFLTLLFVCSCTCSVNPVALRDQKPDKTKLEVARSNIPQVESVAFSGAASAWLVNYESGKLLHTNDGGLNWNQVPENAAGRISQISFIDADNGWAINKVSGRGGVWRTKDSGRTWVPIATIPSGDTQWDYTSAVQITFTDESHGWVIETFSIWRTEDGGVNWKQAFNTLDPRVKGQPVRGFFIDPLKGWVCATRGEVYHTADGGQTWDVQTVDENISFSDIFFAGEGAGWLSSGSAGKIYRTSDQGKTWQLQARWNEKAYIESFFFKNKTEGWGVGRQLLESSSGFMPTDAEQGRVKGIVLHTLDGGDSWEPVEVGHNDPFFQRVYFTDSRHGWLLARDNVYRTDDSGKTWQTVFQLTPVTLSRLSPNRSAADFASEEAVCRKGAEAVRFESRQS